MLDPEKAVALGVRPGRAFAQLKAGQEVEIADGRIVEASEVRSGFLSGAFSHNRFSKHNHT